MLSRLTAPVSNLLGGRAAPPTTKKGVPEILAELAEVRTRKADLEQREQELLAAARAELLKEQQALEELKKKVTDCGIDLSAASAPVPASAPAVSAPESSTPAEQPAAS